MAKSKTTVRRFYHVTPEYNARLIRIHGLHTSMAEGERRVWLCTKSKLKWSVRHVAEHHNRPREEMTVLNVDLPFNRAAQLRNPRVGVYFSVIDIPAQYISEGEQDVVFS